MKLILFLLIPFFVFSQTYVHNIPCTDDAASTVVTNNGTAADWVASHNTEDITSGGTMFALNTNGEYIKSAVNWTAEKFTASWTVDLIWDPALSEEIHLNIGNGDQIMEVNEFQLYRTATSDEWIIKAFGASGSAQTKTTTDFSGDTSPHNYILIVDASVSPWDVSLSVDGITLTWGAWDGSPAVAVFNSLIFFGTTSIFEPDCFVNALLIWETLEDSQGGYPIYKNYKIYGGYK